MKKINYLLITIISIFIFNASVNAKSVSKTCYYNNTGLDSGEAVTITIYDDNSASAKITQYNHKNVDKSVSVQNWNNIKSTYQSNNSCPTYVGMTYGEIFGFGSSVSAYYDQKEAVSDATSKKATLLTSATAGNNASDSEKESIKARVSQISNECNATASYKYSLDSCKNDDKTTTKYSECKNEATSSLNRINSYISEVSGYVSKKYISSNDSSYQTFTKLCNSAKDNLNQYIEALTYISNKEYNEDMGTNIESSVTKRDVSDNKYVQDYYSTSTSSTASTSEDYFELCDSSKNPQLISSLKLIGIFLTIVKVIVPIILIVMGSLDMSKAVISNDNDAIQKSLSTFLKRVIAGILVFFAPSILLALFHMVDGMANFEGKYETCLDCILGSSDCPDVSFKGNS